MVYSRSTGSVNRPSVLNPISLPLPQPTTWHGSLFYHVPVKGIQEGMRHGFTIVEVLVGATVVCILFGALWAAAGFSGRSTGAAMLQADCLRRAALLFTRLQRDVDRAEAVLLPAPGAATGCLVLRRTSGVHQLVYLTKSRRHVVTTDADRERAAVLAAMDDTPARIAGLEFHNRGGAELQVVVAFCDADGRPVPGCSAVTASLALSRGAAR